MLTVSKSQRRMQVTSLFKINRGVLEIGKKELGELWTVSRAAFLVLPKSICRRALFNWLKENQALI